MEATARESGRDLRDPIRPRLCSRSSTTAPGRITGSLRKANLSPRCAKAVEKARTKSRIAPISEAADRSGRELGTESRAPAAKGPVARAILLEPAALPFPPVPERRALLPSRHARLMRKNAMIPDPDRSNVVRVGARRAPAIPRALAICRLEFARMGTMSNARKICPHRRG